MIRKTSKYWIPLLLWHTKQCSSSCDRDYDDGQDDIEDGVVFVDDDDDDEFHKELLSEQKISLLTKR